MSGLALRSRIFIGMVTVVLVATVGMGLGVGSTIEEFVQQAIIEQLRSARQSFKKYMEGRYRLLGSVASSATEAPRLKAALNEIDETGGTEYAATLQALAQAIRRSLEVDLVAIAVSGDKVYADVKDAAALQIDEQSPPVARALFGESYQGVMDDTEAVFMVAAEPISLGGAILGGLVIGERVDEAAVAEFYAALGTDVLVVRDDQPVGWFVGDGAAFDAVRLTASAADALASASTKITDGRFLATTSLGARSMLVLSRSADGLVEMRAYLFNWVVLFGVMAALLAMLFSRWVANRLSHPIRDLVSAADQIADGDLTAVASEVGMAETARLGRSFNRMTRRVRELIEETKAKAEVLRQQKEELEHADQVKTNFMVSASHELRTPVTNIASSVEILLDHGGREDPETCEEFLRTIDVETRRLSDLLQCLLELTKIESGMAQWCEIEFDLCQAVDECLAGFRAAQPERQTEFAHEAPRLVCYGDRDRLQQLIEQLLDNVVKFTPEESPVRLEARERADAIELRVADQGPGIEDKERIFERFVQGGDIMTDKPAGVGLGLPICREIARGFGGTLLCEDDPAGGSAFVLRVPKPE